MSHRTLFLVMFVIVDSVNMTEFQYLYHTTCPRYSIVLYCYLEYLMYNVIDLNYNFMCH